MWIETFTGKQFHFNAEGQEMQDQICIEDIAHSLALQCRYTGHTNRFYSVAEHSCHLGYYAFVQSNGDKRQALTMLLHDAHEAYFGDFSRPFKAYLEETMPGASSGIKDLSSRIDQAVALKYGTIWPLLPVYKQWDTRILLNEREAMLNPSHNLWSVEGPLLEGLNMKGMPWEHAEAEFLHAFHSLTDNKWNPNPVVLEEVK